MPQRQQREVTAILIPLLDANEARALLASPKSPTLSRPAQQPLCGNDQYREKKRIERRYSTAVTVATTTAAAAASSSSDDDDHGVSDCNYDNDCNEDDDDDDENDIEAADDHRPTISTYADKELGQRQRRTAEATDNGLRRPAYPRPVTSRRQLAAGGGGGGTRGTSGTTSGRKMMTYSIGIVLSYAVYGVVQEGVLKARYGPAGERFDFFYSLLFVQCLANTVIARLLLAALHVGADHAGRLYYVCGSALYLGGMIASIVALRYVDYPTQIVAKSAKPLPVMALSVVSLRRRYPPYKWFFVGMIVVGVALFLLEADHVDSSVGSAVDRGGDAVDRRGDAFDRRGDAFDRGADAGDRGGDAADRRGDAADRRGDAFDRGADAVDRRGDAFDRGADAVDRGGDGVYRRGDGERASRCFGTILLSMSVVADGLLGILQESVKLSSRGADTKPLHMMYTLNAIACLYMTPVLLTMGSTEFPEFVVFVHRFPWLYAEVALFAICSAVGQIFIFAMIVEFGPLPCSIVTTVRKFITVLGSVLLFGNELNFWQWLASGLVFLGLVFDAAIA